MTAKHMTFGAAACAQLLACGAAATLAGAAFADGGDHRPGPGACSRTSVAARAACGNEAADDFWIGFGKCLNVAARDERGECRAELREGWRETRQLCGEQFAAREEVCDALGQAPYDPPIDPADFVDPLEVGGSIAANHFLPLVPGTRYVYENEEAGERVTVSVTFETIEVDGVDCIVVHDVVTELDSGELIEDTDDYMAQDIHGNVWYFGEIARNYEDGRLVDLEGSWRAGEDGASAGILMRAAPAAGDVYRQEFLLGEAEDIARVASLSASAESPYASCAGTCLKTDEFTPIEPDGFENKFYKPGLGKILTVDPESGEREELVDIEVFLP